MQLATVESVPLEESIKASFTIPIIKRTKSLKYRSSLSCICHLVGQIRDRMKQIKQQEVKLEQQLQTMTIQLWPLVAQSLSMVALLKSMVSHRLFSIQNNLTTYCNNLPQRKVGPPHTGCHHIKIQSKTESKHLAKSKFK